MVYAILQDGQGFMWFGTQEGLNRFDGMSFKVYKKDLHNEGGLQNDAIFALKESVDGVIWIGTDNGVSLYDPKYDCFSNLDLILEDGQPGVGVVRSIVSDKEDNIWLALENKGVFKVDKEKNVRFYSLKDFLGNRGGSIRDIVFDMEERDENL